MTQFLVMIPLLFFLSLSAYIHVEAFSHSAKGVAQHEIERILAHRPRARLGLVSYPGRAPFQLNKIKDRVDVFLTMVPEHDVNNWDEYLAVIAEFFKAKAPRYIALEDIVLAWTVLLPKKYANDFSKRLDYPNPGAEAWNTMFASIGYVPKKTFIGEPFPEWVYALVGNWHIITIEGVGTNQVVLYERHS